MVGDPRAVALESPPPQMMASPWLLLVTFPSLCTLTPPATPPCHVDYVGQCSRGRVVHKWLGGVAGLSGVDPVTHTPLL